MSSSTGPAEIETDVGNGYVKALGNKEGPHVLAAEWIGTALADWFGLKTFEIALMQVEEDDEITLGHGRMADAGAAIVTRSEPGTTWSGTADELTAVENTEDIAALVVFDTWVRNCDRHPPDLAMRKPNYDNVFLSGREAKPGKFQLLAIDHTHCFNCGRDLDQTLGQIAVVKDARPYGRFPEFEPYLDQSLIDKACQQLANLEHDTIRAVIDEVPKDWEVTSAVRATLATFLFDRAQFVADKVFAASQS